MQGEFQTLHVSSLSNFMVAFDCKRDLQYLKTYFFRILVQEVLLKSDKDFSLKNRSRL